MTITTEERRTEVFENHVDTARIVAKILGDKNGEPVKLSNADMNALGALLMKRHVQARATLEKAGQHAENVWFVLNGTLRLTSSGRVLDVIEAPAIVGDELVLGRSKPDYSIRAETPVNALTIDAESFRSLMKASPQLASAWVSELTNKLEYSRTRMGYLLSGDLTTRLAGLLLHRSHGGQVPLTQATMASLLNVHRASISRALHLLERQGAIDIGYASVKISDQAKLHQIATSL